VRVLGQEDAEVNVLTEDETTQMDIQIKSSTINSVGGKRSRRPRNGRRHRVERKQLNVRGYPPTNNPCR
jgi:hypothetical protein